MKKMHHLLTGIVVVLATIISCEKPAIEIEELQSMQDQFSTISNKKVLFDSPVELAGGTHFASYAVKEQRWVSPWDLNMLTCEATLTHVKGQQFTLETEEYFGTLLFRTLTIDVKITPSGVVSFSFPDTWQEFNGATLDDNPMNLLDQFYLHTGCIPSGPGINKGTLIYKGYFDGTTFYAKSHFTGKQEELGLIPPFYDGSYYFPDDPHVIDGPIQFEFSFELEVVE